MKRGLFFALEGCDRCGKSTQSKLLIDFLEKKNIPVKHMCFPARHTAIGKVIDAYLKRERELPDEAIHLLFSANRWELREEMKTLLKSGVNLIVDRYSYSGVAYSTAKGLDFDWCMFPEKKLLRPDLVLYLNGPIEELAKRGNYGEERYEKLEFQRKVHNVFEQIYEIEKDTWTRVNALESSEVVHENICNLVMKRLNESTPDEPFKFILP